MLKTQIQNIAMQERKTSTIGEAERKKLECDVEKNIKSKQVDRNTNEQFQRAEQKREGEEEDLELSIIPINERSGCGTFREVKELTSIEFGGEG